MADRMYLMKLRGPWSKLAGKAAGNSNEKGNYIVLLGSHLGTYGKA